MNFSDKMAQNQSMVELKEKFMTALRANSENFRKGFEITKNVDLSIDEGTCNKLKSNLQLRQHLLETVKFFGESYIDGCVNESFVLSLLSQLISAETRNNVAVECLCIFLNTIFPKIATNWDNVTKKKLTELIKDLQEFVLASSDYSSRVKELTTEMLMTMKLRFHSEVQVKEARDDYELFTIDDLRNLSLQFLRDSLSN